MIGRIRPSCETDEVGISEERGRSIVPETSGFRDNQLGELFVICGWRSQLWAAYSKIRDSGQSPMIRVGPGSNNSVYSAHDGPYFSGSFSSAWSHLSSTA